MIAENTKSKNLKVKPGVPGSDSDLRVYNVIANLGHAENGKISPIIFQSYIGFSSAKEALLDLHESLRRTCLYIQDIECLCPDRCEHHSSNDRSDNNVDEDDKMVDVVSTEDFIISLQRADWTTTPGNMTAEDYFADEFLWTWYGELVTGVCVTILECAEMVLANKEVIEYQFDLFEGKESKYEGTFALSLALEQNIMMVTNIPSKASV